MNANLGGSAVRKQAPRTQGLASLQERTASNAAEIKERMNRSSKQTERLSRISASLKGAIARADIDTVRILEADFKSARADLIQDGKDLAGAMIGLAQSFKDIGIEITAAQEFTSEEQKLIDEAKALVGRMQGRLDLSQSDLAAAERKTEWFGIRGRAVTNANDSIAKATNDLDGAKANVGVATEIAEQRRRERLENASIDQSMQAIQRIATQIIQMAQDRIEEIETNLEAVEVSRVDLRGQLHELATQIVQGDEEIGRLSAELANLRQEQSEQTQNSPEWAALEARIKDKVNEVAKVEGERNKAFALSQDSQRFAEMYDLQEATQRGLLQYQQTWIAMMEEGVKNRTVLYESMLGIVRAAGDQEAMATHDRIAVETDERLHKGTAEHLVAVRRNIQSRMEGVPEQVRRLRQITEAEAKSKAAFDTGMEKLRQQFNENWGTDPTYNDPSAHRAAS